LGQGTAGSGLAEPGQVQHLTSLGVALRRSALRSLSAKSNSSCRFAQKDADGKRTTLHSQRRRCNAAAATPPSVVGLLRQKEKSAPRQNGQTGWESRGKFWTM